MTITSIAIALVAMSLLARKLVRDWLSRKRTPADPAEKEYWQIHGGR
jgi:hypothetical protein